MFTEFKKYNTFAPTVHTTLPIRTASQGVSFAFISNDKSYAVALMIRNNAVFLYSNPTPWRLRPEKRSFSIIVTNKTPTNPQPRSGWIFSYF
jgi:hypothetical protein